MTNIDLSKYKNELSSGNQSKRFIWNVVWLILARPLPRGLGRKWKLFLLRLFGAKLHDTANVYSSVRIYAPWNLIMNENSCLAPEVDCYNVDMINIGANSTVSQKTYLCAASHDITDPKHPLITKPIIIKDQVWIAAAAYVGPGVTVGQGAVIGATASVYKDVEAWTIVGGNPAKFLNKRIING
jgi:putative colanic acid biosynthesis acetyltransferase WcaF